MNNISKLITIWGAAILLYLLVSNATGTKTLLNSLNNLTSGTTKTLQGR